MVQGFVMIENDHLTTSSGSITKMINKTLEPLLSFSDIYNIGRDVGAGIPMADALQGQELGVMLELTSLPVLKTGGAKIMGFTDKIVKVGAKIAPAITESTGKLLSVGLETGAKLIKPMAYVGAGYVAAVAGGEGMKTLGSGIRTIREGTGLYAPQDEAKLNLDYLQELNKFYEKRFNEYENVKSQSDTLTLKPDNIMVPYSYPYEVIKPGSTNSVTTPTPLANPQVTVNVDVMPLVVVAGGFGLLYLLTKRR